MYNMFEKFPVIDYANNLTTNILARVVFSDAAKKTSSVFYPYAVENGERPDIIAANYYGDARYSWVIYLSNNIVDPYYEWPLTENELQANIVRKYGSVDAASKTIVCYKVNWEGDLSILDVSGYAALPAVRKKYWAPIEGFNSITGYQRSKLDYNVETNKTISISASNTTNLSVNDIINQYTTSGLQIAQGYIKNIANNTLILQHITGEFKDTNSSIIIDSVTYTAGSIKNEANTLTANVSSYTLINNSILDSELIYWTKVNALDYETYLNDSKKIIQLLDKNYLDQVESELDSLL